MSDREPYSQGSFGVGVPEDVTGNTQRPTAWSGQRLLLLVGLPLLVLVAGMSSIFLTGNARLRSQAVGSWEFKTGPLFDNEDVSVSGLVVKCRLAQTTDDRGHNLAINVMPLHLLIRGRPASIPDIIPTLYGVWRIQNRQMIFRIDNIHDENAAYIIPLLELATDSKLLRQEIALNITQATSDRIVIANSLALERVGE